MFAPSIIDFLASVTANWSSYACAVITLHLQIKYREGASLIRDQVCPEPLRCLFSAPSNCSEAVSSAYTIY
jgi:hypothetical protein